MPYKTHKHESSIVVRGNFNPAILHPKWFGEFEIIAKEEADAAKIKIVSPQWTLFSLEWMSLTCTDDSFTVATEDASRFPVMRDLVFGTFQLLEHTPLSAFGFNVTKQVYHDSSKKTFERLAPDTGWEGLGESSLNQISRQVKRDGTDAVIRCTISASPPPIENGIHLGLNEHYDLQSEKNSLDKNQKLLESLEKQWPACLEYFDFAENKLLGGE